MISFSSVSHFTVEAVEYAKNFSPADLVQHVSKRAADHGPDNLSHPFIVGLIIINLVVFLPVILFLGYTLSELIPTLAVVEEDTSLDVPTSYERVSPKEDVAGYDNKDDALPMANEAGSSPRQPVTSSLRSTVRMLWSIRGWASLYRGFPCSIFLNMARVLVALMLALVLPLVLAIIVASIICIPLNTVWVHVVISAPSSTPWWRRLSNVKTIYGATVLPTFALFVAVQISHAVPLALIKAMGVSSTDISAVHHAGDIWKAVLTLGVYAILTAVLVIPTHVALTRVQASLLSSNYQTIIGLNRPLRLEDASSKAYLSMFEAWQSVSRASWVRIAKLYVKIFFATIGVEFIMGTFLALEMIGASMILQKQH